MISCADKKEQTAVAETPVKKVEPAKISNAWRSFNVGTLKITETGVGKFKVGQAYPAQFAPLKSDVKNIIKKTAEGTETVESSIIKSEGKVLFAVQKSKDGKSTQELTVYSPEIKTNSGMGVGSTLSDITSAYPDAKVWYTYVSDKVVVESPSLGNTQFIIDKNGYVDASISYNSDKEVLSLNDFEANTQVKSVRIY